MGDQFSGGAKKIPASKIKKSKQGGSHRAKGGCAVVAFAFLGATAVVAEVVRQVVS